MELIRIPALACRYLALVALISLAPQHGHAQNSGFVVSPLDPPDPADPADPADPTDPIDPPGQVGLDFTVAPEIGLQQTPIPNPDSGFVDPALTGTDTFIQLNPGGQDGVALVETRNMRAASSVNTVAAAAAPAAMLRALDKTTAETTDFEMLIGETVVIGRLAIRLHECRYPVDNPASDAFAHLEIADIEGRALFEGWMVASSPALMALEHPRYDVWVLNCRTS